MRRVECLRRRWWTSAAIATALGLPVSTVGRVLRRLGLNRLRALEPRPVAVRYEKQWPGEQVHIGAKRLARFTRVGHRIHGDRQRHSVRVGWEHVHACVDDATRLAHVEILPAEDGASSAAFVQRATGWLGRLGVRAQRVMTDNAFAYASRAMARRRPPRTPGWRRGPPPPKRNPTGAGGARLD